MSEPLRERQKRVAREAILQALADEVVEHGVSNLSLQAVAARAGVSSRTLYNYFENREALVRGLEEWVATLTEAMGGVVFPDDPARIADYGRTNFRVWDELGNLMRALVQFDALASAEGRAPDHYEGRNRRVAAVEADMATLLPAADPVQITTVAELMRAVVSPRMWHRLTVELGLPLDTASEVAGWAYASLRDALAADQGSFEAEVVPGTARTSGRPSTRATRATRTKAPRTKG